MRGRNTDPLWAHPHAWTARFSYSCPSDGSWPSAGVDRTGRRAEEIMMKQHEIRGQEAHLEGRKWAP